MTKLNLTTAERKEHKRKLRARWLRKHRVEYNEGKRLRWHGTHKEWLLRAFAKAGVPAWEIEQRRKLLARKTI